MIANQDLEALIRMFEQSHWKELELHIDGNDIFLSKDETGRASWGGKGTAPAPVPALAAPGLAPDPAPAAPAHSNSNTGAGAAAPPQLIPEGCVVVTAPSLGTFYRSPKPGSPPFAEIGQVVSMETELCLIEVMKLFTTLRAGVAGEIVEILVQDGDLVEFEQPLFVIRADG